MDYKLCARILMKETSDDVKELVNAYVEESRQRKKLVEVIREQKLQIVILESENNIMKKELNARNTE